MMINHPVRKPFTHQLMTGNVERQRKLRPDHTTTLPLEQLTRTGLNHPFTDCDDLAALLGQRDELDR